MNDFNQTRDDILQKANALLGPGTIDAVEKRYLSLQILQLEVLLDIRDTLWRIEGKEGVRKWGPKL